MSRHRSHTDWQGNSLSAHTPGTGPATLLGSDSSADGDNEGWDSDELKAVELIAANFGEAGTAGESGFDGEQDMLSTRQSSRGKDARRKRGRGNNRQGLLDRLCKFLKERRCMILLDNCDTCSVAELADFVETLRDEAKHVLVLATRRRPIGSRARASEQPAIADKVVADNTAQGNEL